MDFDSRFLEVKAVLEQFEGKIGVKLKSIRKPNTEESKNHLALLLNSLKKIQLIVENKEDDKRRFHLFLLINTLLPISNTLEEDRNFCHLVGRCPTLSTFIYFTIVDSLGLFPYVAETILYAPNEFSESLLDVFTNFGKYVSDPFDELIALDTLLTSVYKKLSHNVCIQTDNCNLVKKFQEILLTYKKPSQLTLGKLVSWTELEKNKYYGFLVLSLTSVLLECTKSSFETNTDENFSSTTFNNLYNFSNFKVSERSEDTDENIISECYEPIVSITKTFMIEKISSSTFLDWCEVDISETKTLQRVVGEKIYLCRRALMNAQDSISVSKNLKNTLKDLIYCFSHLEIKPLSLAEELSNMSFEQLIHKFDETHETNSNEDNALILRKLLQDPQAFEEPAEIIRLLPKSSTVLKYDDFKYLIHRYHSTSRLQFDRPLSEVEKVIFESIKVLPIEEQVILLEEYLEVFSDSQPYNKDFIHFEEKLVEVFNKFVSSSSSRPESQFLSEIIFLCFYSVGDVAVKILLECLKNLNYIKDMVPILKTLRLSLQKIQSSCNLEQKLKILRKVSDNEGKVREILENSHGDLLIDLLHILIFDEDTKRDSSKRSRLLDLVSYLIDESVIEKNIFYIEVILNNSYLSRNNSNSIVNFLLQFLVKVLVESPDESVDIEIHAVLIQLAQMVDKIRWEQKSFASWRAAMLSNLVYLISSIMKKSEAQLFSDQKKASWMKSYIRTFSAQTQFLFSPKFLCSASNSAIICPGEQPDTFGLVLNTMHNDKFDSSAFDKFSEVEVAWAFFEVLSTSCDEEWNLFSLTLSRNKFFNEKCALSLFNKIVDGMLVGIKLMEISLAEDDSQARSWINCYYNTLNNFSCFLTNFLLKYLLMHATPSKVKSFKKLTFLLQNVPAKVRSQSSLLFIKSLISFIPHLVEDVNNNSKAVLFTEVAYNAIRYLDPETRQLFAKKAESFLLKKVPTPCS